MHPNKTRTLGVWVQHESGKWIDPKHAWRDPSDASMVVHDAFHHRENDCGTNEQEWVTLGVELWLKGLEEHSELFDFQVGNIIEYLMGSLIEMPEEGGDSRFAEKLHPAPTNTFSSTRKPSEKWHQLIADGIKETLGYTGYEVADIDDYATKAAQWAWVGYLRAEQRYPDPYRTKMHSMALERISFQCGTLAKSGVLQKWTARWDDTHGVRAAWQDKEGRWHGVTLPGTGPGW